MTNEGIFTEAKLVDKVFKLQQLIKDKNNYIKIQDKEIDILKSQIDLKETEIEMLKKKYGER